MEILDFLRIARRRLALLLLVPLLAVAAAVTIGLLQPPMYSSSATVASPAPIGSTGSRFTGPQGVNQYAAAFQATATGPSVGVVVSDEVEISQSDLRSGLSVTQYGASSTMVVQFTGARRDEVAQVVQAVSAQTLVVIFQTQVDAETSRVEAGRAELTKANEAIAEFGAENGVADPERAYDALLSQQNQLIQQQAGLKADGNSVGAAAMESSITDVKESLATFAPILAAYDNLKVERDAAQAAMASAQAALSQANAQLAAADPEKLVYVSQPQRAGRMGPLVRTAIPVGAAALFMTVLLVALLEVAARSRASRSAARAVEGGPTLSTESEETSRAGEDRSTDAPVTTGRPPRAIDFTWTSTSDTPYTGEDPQAGNGGADREPARVAAPSGLEAGPRNR